MSKMKMSYVIDISELQGSKIKSIAMCTPMDRVRQEKEVDISIAFGVGVSLSLIIGEGYQ